MTHAQNTEAPVLCGCGCGQPTPVAKRTRHDLGHVRGQPVPFVPGHNGMKQPRRKCPRCKRWLPRDAFDPQFRPNGTRSGLNQRCRACVRAFHARNEPDAWQRRFWNRVDTTAGPNECWEWTAGRTKSGYGSFSPHLGTKAAHRIAWELTHGPVPDGLFVCHRCDNPPCCNPAHLFLGTNADNVADRNAKGRTRTGVSLGEAHGRAKLTEDAVRAIRAEPPTVENAKRFAAQFGVGQSCVRAVQLRETWKHVHP